MYEHTSYYNYSDSNMSNAVVAFFGGLPQYVFAFVSDSPSAIILGAFMSFIFFMLGKAIDVGIKIYFDRRNENRLNGIKNSSDDRN